MSFSQVLSTYDWSAVEAAILNAGASDVEAALEADHRNDEDLFALLSPAAEPYLEEMAQRAHDITLRRFGRIIQLYAPVYVSSECTNSCVYCGFNRHNRIGRATLTVDEAVNEAMSLHRQGFRHILLVSGESPKHVPVSYLCEIADRLRSRFASLSIEVYPMDVESYRSLIRAGVDGLTVYQETYDRIRYAEVHPAGRKRDYHWRLEAVERGGEAGFRKLNVGALLGLSNWRTDGAFVGIHGAYLMRRYWKSHISVSFPRLRPAAGGFQPAFSVSDREMVQLMCALRLSLPDAGLVLSTRESMEFRDNLVPLGITQMSAGSKTAPGGYTSRTDTEGQFQVSDHRSPAEVARMIASKGYEPVWKDWDAAFLDPVQGAGCEDHARVAG